MQYTANIIAFSIIHEQVCDCVASTNVSLLLQKLEEFLFCMEDNHPEVGNANTVSVWLNVISVIKVPVALTLGLLGHRRIH